MASFGNTQTYFPRPLLVVASYPKAHPATLTALNGGGIGKESANLLHYRYWLSCQ